MRYGFALAMLLLGAAACGGDDNNGPSVTYENIANTYVGGLSGVSQGVALQANLGLTITQSGGSLAGTYAIDGTLSDGITQVAIAGTGTLVGSIAPGSNPSVNITVRPTACPSNTAQFSGAYDSANRRLTISGPVEMFDNACQTVITYPSTIILTN